MYTETSAKLRYKNFLQAAIFFVLISPTGDYTQIEWAGTFVDDFVNPLSTESNALWRIIDIFIDFYYMLILRGFS